MLYRVVVSQEVFDRLDAYVDYIAIEQQAPLNAERWLRKAWQRIQTLKTFPNRCPKAPEDKQFDFTVRMLIVDRCLFLYTLMKRRKKCRCLALDMEAKMFLCRVGACHLPFIFS